MKHLSSIAASLAVAASLVALPLHAQAASSARVSVEIKDIKIELIDLTPDDGETPWINFTEQRYHGFLVGGSPFGMGSVNEPGEVTLGSGDNIASAGSFDDRIRNDQQVVSGKTAVGFTTHASRTSRFVVSPWTMVRVTGLASVDGESSGNDSYFEGSAFISLTLGNQSDIDYRKSERDETAAWTLMTELSTGATGSEALLHSSIDSHANAAPVPEPSTYGMLLAGIGIIGAAVRGKARKQHA